MKITIIITPIFYLFLSCNFVSNELDKFILVNSLEIKSSNDISEIMARKNKLDSNWVKSFFKETNLYDKNGEYYENMSIEFYPVANLQINKSNYYFILKNVSLVDGNLQELYVFNIDSINELNSLVLLTKHENADQCNTEFELKTNTVKETKICDVYNEKDDNQVEIKKISIISFNSNQQNKKIVLTLKKSH